ncbi:MAG: FAD-binding oxidoreductase [Alphaproteobacteria bacterium]|nr:FAD-binding oxidoreductase [Alphaproteobacteria bacterium]
MISPPPVGPTPIGSHAPAADDTPLPAAYQQVAPPPLGAPMLDGRVVADVAVVGAGYTGLSTALHLAERGVRAVVVEAREVGWGGSGRAFGQVVPYAKHGQDHILAHFGPERGERIIAMLGDGPDTVFGLIEKHAIACEAVRAGLLFAAHTAANAGVLERRARFWQERGAPTSFLDRDATEALTGSRFYPAALLDRRGGTLNPLGYARGLAHAAVAAGARIYELSPATALRPRAGGWEVAAGKGTVEAEQVVLATDAYTDALWPGLARSLIPLRAYHLVSAPLTGNLQRAVLPGRQSLTDTRHLYSGIRMRPDGRIHIGVDGPAFRNGAHPYRHKATQRIARLFPALADIRWEDEVAGWVGMTADQYPHIHSLAPGMWAGIGLNGRGIAFGTLLGRELALRLLGRPEQELAMPVTPLRPIAVRPFARPLVGSLMQLYRVVDGIALRGAYLRNGR